MASPMPRLAPVTIATLPGESLHRSSDVGVLAIRCQRLSACLPCASHERVHRDEPAARAPDARTRLPAAAVEAFAAQGLPRHHHPRHRGRGRDEPGRALRAPPLQGGAALPDLPRPVTSGPSRWCEAAVAAPTDPVEQLGGVVEDFVARPRRRPHRRPGHQLRAGRPQPRAPGRDRRASGADIDRRRPRRDRAGRRRRRLRHPRPRDDRPRRCSRSASTSPGGTATRAAGTPTRSPSTTGCWPLRMVGVADPG